MVKDNYNNDYPDRLVNIFKHVAMVNQHCMALGSQFGGKNDLHDCNSLPDYRIFGQIKLFEKVNLNNYLFRVIFIRLDLLVRQ